MITGCPFTISKNNKGVVVMNNSMNWDALLEQCKKDAQAQDAALEWYLNEWVNMSEKE